MELTLEDVFRTARNATELIGGGYIETPSQRIVLHAQASGATTRELSQAVLATRDGLPDSVG